MSDKKDFMAQITQNGNNQAQMVKDRRKLNREGK